MAFGCPVLADGVHQAGKQVSGGFLVAVCQQAFEDEDIPGEEDPVEMLLFGQQMAAGTNGQAVGLEELRQDGFLDELPGALARRNARPQWQQQGDVLAGQVGRPQPAVVFRQQAVNVNSFHVSETRDGAGVADQVHPLHLPGVYGLIDRLPIQQAVNGDMRVARVVGFAVEVDYQLLRRFQRLADFVLAGAVKGQQMC